MPIAATSVVSAAVIGGDLILGLSDGGIINCGRVQGPQGLKGDQGPMGATGRAGTDGNTIHTVQGAPDGSLGRDGDFAINTVVWEIYGPKAGGTWGTGTPLRGNKRGDRESKDPIFGMQSSNGDGSGGGGGTGQTYTTGNLPLAGTGRLLKKDGRISVPGGNIIPEANGLKYQSNLNSWTYDSLAALDEALPINTVSELPNDGKYDGDMVLFNGSLWIWSKGSWIEVGGAVEEGAYLPLAGGEMEGEINMAHNAIHNVADPALQKDAANRQYVDGVSLRAASVASTQADWINQTYSSGVWILQTGGAATPDLQRFIVTGEDFADTSDLGKAKYISIHALGGGDFIQYQNEKPGDTLQIYGNPLTGDKIASFGIYEIEEITEHNFPDNPQDDGADFSDAFVAYTVKPLASYGTVEEDELCQIKTMPPVGLAGGASVHVGELPPDEKAEGDLWYDSTRLELFVYYVDGDGNGGWVPCSPLGARVEAGEIVQAQLLERVSAGETAQTTLQGKVADLETKSDDYLKKTGDTFTGGALRFKRTDDVSYWSYITGDTPNAWHTDNKTHGIILNIGTSNSYKQQFKIQGRSGRDLFEIHDDGAAVATVKGNLNVTNALKQGGKQVLITEGDNTVATSFRLKSGNNTLISASGNELSLYNVKTPTNPAHGANAGYVDDRIAEEIAKIEIPEIPEVPEVPEGAIARSGTDSDPTLKRGELYLCTSNSTLYIGI